jgi:hypothetical protein
MEILMNDSELTGQIVVVGPEDPVALAESRRVLYEERIHIQAFQALREVDETYWNERSVQVSLQFSKLPRNRQFLALLRTTFQDVQRQNLTIQNYEQRARAMLDLSPGYLRASVENLISAQRQTLLVTLNRDSAAAENLAGTTSLRYSLYRDAASGRYCGQTH